MRAQTDRLVPLDFTSVLVCDELQRRQDRLFERRHKQAHFRDPERSLDRLVRHAHVLKCGPRSWRTKFQIEPQHEQAAS